eukprot:Hpha_TRINITY_DN16472_c0_g4::TRINITY_DN16472_c0_g4_i1::g.160626::m.160626
MRVIGVSTTLPSLCESGEVTQREEKKLRHGSLTPHNIPLPSPPWCTTFSHRLSCRREGGGKQGGGRVERTKLTEASEDHTKEESEKTQTVKPSRTMARGRRCSLSMFLCVLNVPHFKEGMGASEAGGPKRHHSTCAE